MLIESLKRLTAVFRLNPRLRDWRGKSVWLVGASTGIGRAFAIALARAGAHVAISARPSSSLTSAVAECLSAGASSCQAVPLDVTDATSVSAAWALLCAQSNPPEFVLFCAGTFKPMRAQDFDLVELQRQLDVNYVGALRVLDAVIPTLIKRGSGHVSLVSSVAGYRGLPKSLAYGPSKAALTHLAENLYIDLKDSIVAVSVVCPGFVSTPLTAQNDFHMPALMTPDAAAQAMLSGYASGAFEIHFPKRFSRTLKALKLLPDALYFNIVKRMTGL